MRSNLLEEESVVVSLFPVGQQKLDCTAIERKHTVWVDSDVERNNETIQ